MTVHSVALVYDFDGFVTRLVLDHHMKLLKMLFVNSLESIF